MRKDHAFVMRNGVEIPEIGFGTWQIPNKEAHDSVTMALKNGYTHIDTAYAYQNEENVGKAIREFDIPRDQVFVTSKLPSHIKNYEDTLTYFQETLDHLGMDYLDLFLIHAPWPWDDIGADCTEGNIQAWKAMEKLFKDGKIRTIGVSNFSVSDLQAIIDSCEIVPFVNQIPFYIGKFHEQKELLDFCEKHEILVEAYSPLATGEVLNSDEIKKLAEKYNRTPAQICIRYCLQKDTLPLPKSTHEGRIIENSKIDFEISEEDMNMLDDMEDVRKK
ncbi:aldo/keto reductase [Jeotgalibaca sp. MA1X17-3]|uniref:aldo/keto reductase n=1 Tax=Jeotgalibaca sp. MA1X17-3 TaxID=2908211 RepID=UPI001F2BC4AD|nr:aldo/keto reductase [Jeotgalibaca sp. MA1X17-3]UJF16151.1 aldo/keto reductase [Jeotgalibaca sp. MA1X17-3]